MTLDFSPIFNLNGLLDGLIDKNISKVDLLLSKVGLWTQALSFKLQGKSLLSAGNVTESNTFVCVGLSWTEGDCDSNFAVGPDLSHQRFNFENIVLEKEQVIFNSFSDSFIFISIPTYAQIRLHI